MPIELLLLLLAWAATISLLVVLPWAVVRLAVKVLEADVSKLGADREDAQPHQTPDVDRVDALSREPDEAVKTTDAVQATGTSNEDADR